MASVLVVVTVNTGEKRDYDPLNPNDWSAGEEIRHEHKCLLSIPSNQSIEGIEEKIRQKYRIPKHYIWFGGGVSGNTSGEEFEWCDGEKLILAYGHPIVMERIINGRF